METFEAGVEFLRGLVSGIIFQCPVIGGSPSECLLRHIRLKSVSDRLRWLNSLGKDELLNLYIEHLKCFLRAEKLGSGLDPEELSFWKKVLEEYKSKFG